MLEDGQWWQAARGARGEWSSWAAGRVAEEAGVRGMSGAVPACAGSVLNQRLLHALRAVLIGRGEAQVVVGAQVEAAPRLARQLEAVLLLGSAAQGVCTVSVDRREPGGHATQDARGRLGATKADAGGWRGSGARLALADIDPGIWRRGDGPIEAVAQATIHAPRVKILVVLWGPSVKARYQHVFSLATGLVRVARGSWARNMREICGGAAGRA